MNKPLKPKVTVKKTIFYGNTRIGKKGELYHQHGWTVILSIGVQSFELSMKESKKEAQWYAMCLRLALINI